VFYARSSGGARLVTESRLVHLDPALDAAINQDVAARVALLAVVTALESCKSEESLVVTVLSELKVGSWRGAQRRRAEVEALVASLDDQYFDLYDAAGEENTPAVLQAFSKARAVAALAQGLAEDPVIAAKEALYEACASLEEPELAGLLADVRRIVWLR